MSVKLLTENHLELLSLKGGCKASSESALVKKTHCWKSHVTAHVCVDGFNGESINGPVNNFSALHLDEASHLEHV